MKRRRPGLWLSGLLLAGLLALLAAALWQGRPRTLPAARLGAAFPALPRPVLGRAPGLLQTVVADGQPRLVNLWASWCGPCRQEQPLLMALAARLRAKGQGGRLVGLNYRDTPQDATAFLAELGNPFALTLVDVDGRLAIELGAYGAPETYLVDAEGHIAFRHVGALTQEVIDRDLLPKLEAP
ncbi:DsbE family thiol:disulfide interchange protein [Ideonella azotifigens]|uniref:DsbE family thiol:disulfide interchange protein n=1 Tax=Ideonella azotifigens TaxID=513160 RepID=A0ABN1KGM1_9BURK|nr:DsbE family thiol:disulfide interchange protein [Ideonella azotifigens]MCD2340480.1 DsbE family thiol:disulfide interchange protein [Ideonella azotifigens]